MTLVLPVPSCGGGVRGLGGGGGGPVHQVGASNGDLVNSLTQASSQGSVHASRKKLAMPCGFDGEPLDFESALMLQTDFASGADWSPLKSWSSSAESIASSTTLTSNGGDANKNQVSLANEQKAISTTLISTTNDDICEASQIASPCKRKPIESAKNFDQEESEPVCKRSRCASVEEGVKGHCETTSLADDLPLLTNTSPPLPLPTPKEPDAESISPSTCTEEEDLFTPRRRVPMLWSPRLRLKDERRRVFKISLNKLRRIDDPELFLRRSVLVNNTMKRLQREIREEKCAKYQQSIHDHHSHHHHHHHHLLHSSSVYGNVDVQLMSGVTTPSENILCKEPSNNTCNGGGHVIVTTGTFNNSPKPWGFDTQPPEDGFPNKKPATLSSCSLGRQSPIPNSTMRVDEEGQQDSSGSSSDEGSSCDEIFGINEDFLRIHIPKSPPTPVSLIPDIVDSVSTSQSSSPSVTEDCHSPNHSPCDRSSSEIDSRRTPQDCCSRLNSGAPSKDSCCDSYVEVDITRTNGASIESGVNGRYQYRPVSQYQNHLQGAQCSAQYRTHQQQEGFGSGANCTNSAGGLGNEHFTPGMPILDSVVYHSLLASLES